MTLVRVWQRLGLGRERGVAVRLTGRTLSPSPPTRKLPPFLWSWGITLITLMVIMSLNHAYDKLVHQPPPIIEI